MEPADDTVKKQDDFVQKQDDAGVLLDLSNIPLEVLELILAQLTDPISQRRLAQVCKLWRATVLRLRWLRLVTWERRLHLRLPLASSLHETGGEDKQGFSLLLCVDSPVLLAGTAVFLPYRDKVRHDVSGNIQLVRHGTAHQGPVGQEVLTHQFQLTREQAMEWQEDCHGQTKSCMQGPVQEQGDTGSGGTLGAKCRGLHPLPVMFHCVLELEPGVRYLLSLSLVEESGGCLVSEEVGTVWGHEGVPRRRRGEEDQNHFRWFQVYRHNMSSSVSSGQFPIIYYIA